MQQSNFVFGALAVAFVIFVTTRGSLPTYMSVLFGTADAPAAPGTAATASSGGSSGTSTYTPAGQAARDYAGGLVGSLLKGIFN